MTTKNHYSCKVEDVINGGIVQQRHTLDPLTPAQAVKHFKSLPIIKRYLGRPSLYTVFIRANSIDLNEG